MTKSIMYGPSEPNGHAYQGIQASDYARVHAGNNVYNNSIATQNGGTYFHTLSQQAKDKMLLEATAEGLNSRLKLLLDACADPDAKDKDGYSALHYAAMHGRLECAKLLIDRGADINYIQEETGSSALQWSLTSQHFAVAECLLEQNATMGSTTDEEKCIALYFAVWKGENDLVEMLLQLVDDPDRVPQGDQYRLMTPLAVAARKGNVGAFRLLLRRGANILAGSEDGFQCLHHAALKGRKGILVFTLTEIPDVNAETDNGQTAIMLAMRNLHIGIIPMLVKEGAHLDVKDLGDCLQRCEEEFRIRRKWDAGAVRMLQEWIATMPRE